MDFWLAERAEFRHTEKRHGYDIADLGRIRELIDEAFAGYRESLSERRIRESRLYRHRR